VAKPPGHAIAASFRRFDPRRKHLRRKQLLRPDTR